MAVRPHEDDLYQLLRGVKANEVAPRGTDAVQPSVASYDVLIEPSLQDTTTEEDDPTNKPTDKVPEEGDQGQPQSITGEADFRPFTLRSVFAHHDSHPLLLDMLLLEKYGIEWLGWEPETLWQAISEDFKTTISTANAGMVQAARTCHLTEAPWVAWEIFTPVCQALNNNIPNFKTFFKPTIAQTMFAVEVMNSIDDRKFSEELERFVAAVFLDASVFYLPPPVDFAQKTAMRIEYRCSKCGRVDLDDDNLMCDSCGAPQSALKTMPKWDPEPTRKRYELIVSQGEEHDVLQEKGVDVQVAKLLVARNYLAFRRQQLTDQLKAVKDERVQLRSSVR
jgi:ribosomal protein L37E